MGKYSDFRNNRAVAHAVAARIMVIGVGGAGGNTVDHIYQKGIKGVNLVNCNTDSKALNKSPLADTQKICMGDGKGAGNDAKVGRRKAQEALGVIRGYVEAHKPDLVILAAGMGGGTGTGATPVIAQMIHALGMPMIAILTTPPFDEGQYRFEQAAEGIQQMQDFVDTFIVIKNDTISEQFPDLSVTQAFNKANDVVASTAKGISEVALSQSNLVSVDISDVCKVVRNSHCAITGMATATGKDRIIKAIESAIHSPLFGNVSVAGTKEVLINFATANEDDLKLNDVKSALAYIQKIGASENSDGKLREVNIIWGTSVKPELAKDEVEVFLVVTGFPADVFYHKTFDGKLKISIPDSTVEVTGDPEVEAVPYNPANFIVQQEQPTTPQTEKVVEPVVEAETDEDEVAEPEIVEPEQPIAPEPEIIEPKVEVVEPKVEVIEPKVEVVEPKVEIVEPKPEVVEPKVEIVEPKVEVVEPKVEIVEPKPEVVEPEVEEQQQPSVADNKSWAVPVPNRTEIPPIAARIFDSEILKMTCGPAYQRRKVQLLTEVKGKKSIVGKRKDEEVSSTQVDGATQSLGF